MGIESFQTASRLLFSSNKRKSASTSLISVGHPYTHDHQAEFSGQNDFPMA
jgi:hypothetical protein